MVTIPELRQGDIVWVDYGIPFGSEPGFRRPSLVVQGDDFNASRIATTVCIPLTSNLRLAAMPGTVLLKPSDTGLGQDSVANSAQITTIDRSMAYEWVGRIRPARLAAVFKALDLVLGR
ncbi:MAG: mRNA interferase MazF2 [Novosphingobium sp.]|nr:mRNA interferase MazF2 [Novosphingobium sp.]MBX9642488.1 type II toxin-antitoxin system PemK/MazF family toxin [Novosphingobium sp.]